MFKQVCSLDDQKGAIRIRGNVTERKAYFASGFTQYVPYQLKGKGDHCLAAAPAAEAVGNIFEIGVPQGETTTTAGWYWCVIEGPCTLATVGTTDIADNAFLKVAAAAVNAILDHATVPTAAAFAQALAANATDTVVTNIAVVHLGHKPTVS